MPLRTPSAFRRNLHRVYGVFTLAFLAFAAVLAWLEYLGFPRQLIGLIFLLATLLAYAGFGLLSRTTDPDQYYVAGRQVPALYNGAATAADWMSAASFMSLAGTLYATGYAGLAFVLGWSGGFVLVGLLLAPYLRRLGQYTIADFLAARYGGNGIRVVAVLSTLLCSFTYVVAQIYGVGLITARLTGLAFEIGIFLGLGGILVCSFLGGMRAVTWTQVGQFIVLMLAYLIPVVWLSVQQTGVPVPQLVYGYQLEQVSQRERALIADPAEIEVRQRYEARATELAEKLQHPSESLAAERVAATLRSAQLRAAHASAEEIVAADRALFGLPKDTTSAIRMWEAERALAESRAKPLNGMPPHADAFPAPPQAGAEVADAARRNFLALAFCLMVGTAGLPHLLMRFNTTPTVHEARLSVAWALLFIVILYISAPALAVLVKFEIFHHVIGSTFEHLPAWIKAWGQVDPPLVTVRDINRDGVLQLGELWIDPDIIVLLAPEIGGLPYIVSALVAVGGLAAALSTADGLLLSIASALSHDAYFRLLDPRASNARRVTISKVLLLVVALCAAYLAAQRPADILFLVAAAFSFAGAAFFPALVLGVFWKRATAQAAWAGMIVGLGVTIFYIGWTHPGARALLGLSGTPTLWWEIVPSAAGIFGVLAGFATIVVWSLLTPPPTPAQLAMVDRVRSPDGGADSTAP